MVEESAWLGFTRVCKLIRISQEGVKKFGRGLLDLLESKSQLGLLKSVSRLGQLGSTSWAPPSRDLSRDPTQRPRWGGGPQRGPSDDQVNAPAEIVLRV
ncbi:hypothetical protein B296_00012273 [Ensete ventricosum]|uniref:Uncharacterized protein n=1 Tax=Ensete ventricosum TaxID=4639 RepID=A0A426ZRZ8_ENSVE|nr:hypothetical protein B296_00012273 [Ensete ventricosum]